MISLTSRISAIEKSIELNTQIELPIHLRVVAYGLLNSGKSTLLNTLTGKFEKEFFKTSDVRETTEILSLIHEGVEYIDTPGIDATHDDDNIADQALSQADIVLFAHQSIGELDAREVDALTKICEKFGKVVSKSVFVLITKSSELSDRETEEIVSKVSKQCENICIHKINVIPVSSSRYKKGISENKPMLIKNSHIEIIKNHIDIDENVINSIRKSKLSILVDELTKIIDENNILLETEKQAINGLFDEFKKHFSKFRNYVKTSKSNFDAL